MVSHGFQGKKEVAFLSLSLHGKVPFYSHALSGKCVTQDSHQLFTDTEKVSIQVVIVLKDLCALREWMAWDGLNPVNLSCSFGLEMVADTSVEVTGKK